MVTPKSQSELLLSLFSNVFLDLTLKYPALSKSFARDLLTLDARISSEGVSFVTKTLPKLGKAFESALETTLLNVPREFQRSHENQAIPAFLQGMLSRCFDGAGRLVDFEPSLCRDIRQVLFLAYRVEFPFSPTEEHAVLASFEETDTSLLHQSFDDDLIADAALIVEEVFSDFDPKDITPRHGPGAVATGERMDAKWRFSRLYNRLHQKYPYYDYFVAGRGNELVDRLEWYRSLSREDSGVAKVVLVPKDSRGPRLISCEPLEYQWIQQGIGRKMMKHIEKNYLTMGHVNFTDQTINRTLALASSQDQKYCTIDLKDASDRVSLKLVESLFPKVLFAHLNAARTTATKLPDGRILPLNKFAPMGSALCFPVEAMCFWALAVAAISRESGISLRRAASQVYVYGDDIIVASCYMLPVMRALESCHLRVNMTKSFRDGYFRESCGMDAYKGVDVTPVKVRTLWTGKPSDGSAYASYVSYANSFASKGYECTSRYVWEILESTYGIIPYGVPESSYPCRWTTSRWRALFENLKLGFTVRRSADTQCVQIRAIFLKNKEIGSELDGWPRLLRDLTMPSERDPSKVVLPHSTQIKRGWRRLL